MTAFIERVFSTIFGDNVILATILIAVVPIIELKGAIPFSMSTAIWGSNALSYWSAFLCGLLGSCMVVPFLALLYIPIINWLKKTKLFKNLALKIENKINNKKQNIENKTLALEDNANTVTSLQEGSTESTSNQINTNKDANNKVEDVKDTTNNFGASKKSKTIYNKAFFLKILGVFVFVAIPLPLTGVWTGTCLAIALGLGFWWSCLAVISGNMVAGAIITIISRLFGDNSLIFFYIFLALILVIGIFLLIKSIINKKKSQQQN